MDPILIVEDHEGLRRLLSDLLSLVFPHNPVVATASGEDALAAVENSRPLLAVMDIGLPGMNGIEAARRIKSRHPGARIVMLSIYEEERYRIEARDAGADAYVAKSQLSARLVPTIRGLFGTDEAQAANGDGIGACGTDPSGGTETILVAEDDPTLRKLFIEVLGSVGYEVIMAEDGLEAVRKFRDHRDEIRLALLDIIMPGKNGKEVADEIRKVNPGIRVVFTSGYAVDIMGTRSAIGPDEDFIMKPVGPRELLRKIRQSLNGAVV